jgi:uncharacterized protein (UPF0332 family)
MKSNLKWCFGLNGGIRAVESNERLAKSYITEAKLSLERAEKNFEDGDLLWTTVVIYYAEYYSLYSFLQRIGIKCENHSCSILAVTYVLGSDKTRIINQSKSKRIDAQYYMRIDKKKQVNQMLNEAKIFVSEFDEIVSNITEKEVEGFKQKLLKLVVVDK